MAEISVSNIVIVLGAALAAPVVVQQAPDSGDRPDPAGSLTLALAGTAYYVMDHREDTAGDRSPGPPVPSQWSWPATTGADGAEKRDGRRVPRLARRPPRTGRG
ncbi:hypothetical protein [Streptomyces sp. NPDC048295]|uniref:hypothetical protein n=1 Tax=Streptomyces sp. NPDC048295 TaxID=3154617 RepID=UPI0034472B14